jgi:drug/metabolite transporter (DMT)-like permease
VSTAVVTGHAGETDGAGRTPARGLIGGAMTAVIVIWGFGPPVTKLISAPALVSVSVRFWISVPLVWLITYATGRRMSIAILRRTALAGLMFGANLAFLFAALQHASIAVMSVIQALSPGVVLLVAGRWLGERATAWHVAWTGVGILGVVIVIAGGDPQVESDSLGVVLAAVSMLTFTAYYLINRRVRSTTETDPIQWMAGATLFAALTITPIALATSSPDDYRKLAGADWLYLLFVALVVGIVSHVMMSWAHRYIAASRSSLMILATNVVAVLVAWPIHDEPVTWVQVAGGAVVLGAVAAVLSRPPIVEPAGPTN